MKSTTTTTLEIGLLLFLVSVGLALLGISFYGLYLAFSASVVLGIVTFFVEPAPLVFGLVKIFFDVDLAQKIVEFLQNQ